MPLEDTPMTMSATEQMDRQSTSFAESEEVRRYSLQQREVAQLEHAYTMASRRPDRTEHLTDRQIEGAIISDSAERTEYEAGFDLDREDPIDLEKFTTPDDEDVETAFNKVHNQVEKMDVLAQTMLIIQHGEYMVQIRGVEAPYSRI